MPRSRSRERLPDPKRPRVSYEGTGSSRRDRSPSPAGGSSSGRRERDRYEDDRRRGGDRKYRDREDDYTRDRKRSDRSRYEDDRYRSSRYDDRERDRDRGGRYNDDDRYSRDAGRDRDRERDRTRDDRDRGTRVRDRSLGRETTDSPVHKANPALPPPTSIDVRGRSNGATSPSTPLIGNTATIPGSPLAPNRNSPAPISSSSAPPPPPDGTPLSAEEEKKRRKAERLEAWRKAQAAKAAAAEVGKAISGSIAGAASAAVSIGNKLGGAKPAIGLPAKPAFSLPSATLSRIGLPIKAGLPAKPAAGLVMDDSDASDRKLQKLNLPPVDPLVAPGGLAPDEMVSENLDVVSDDEDEVVPGLGSTSKSASNKMEVDEEEEEDPLDAFMKGNTEEVKKVNKEDEKKFGGPVTSGPRAEVLNEDDEGGEEDEPQRDGPMTAEDILALAAKKAKKKDLPVAQHGKIDYEPFRKKFYVPNQETNDMDEEDVELMRIEMDGIKIRGADCPRPVKNWGAFGLPAGCYDVIKKLGYTAPTSIQAQAIPAIMSGRDMIGVAKTGSGKTIAFLLPLFRHIKDQRPLETGEGPLALIMTPTRELATQIWRESKPFLTALNMRAVCAYGGAPLSEQIGDMKKGAEVVVCTPGRMIDLLTANSGRVTNLRRCTYLVLDEADRMFDMGFEPQVMKIVNNIRPDRQTLLFSATFPAKMDALARKILIKPLEITVGGRSVVAKEITQQVEIRDADQKFLRLLEILGEMGEKYKDEEDFRTLIFVERQESADELFRELMRKGYICTSLHGGKDQVDRDQAISDFKAGYIPIVIATSVAARGLDVKELKLVINYDCPNHMEDYVHRAGRTGRAGNSGTCITFIQTDQDRYAVDIVRALKASEANVPPELEKLSEDFLVKVREGKAKVAGSGFGGKGLDKFEAERESKDRAERAFYGEDGARVEKKPGADGAGDAGSGGKDKAKDGAGGTVPPDYGFDFKVEIVKGAAPDKVAPGGSTKPANATPATPQNTLGADVAKLPAQTLAALQRAEAAGKGGNVMENLQSAVARITAHLNKTKAEKNAANSAQNPQKDQPAKSSDATEYHAIVPINDYPQKARWKATNKEQMVQLQELSGASITNKGIFYEAGKEPGPGQEPKLHLLIESNDEFRVKLAVDELRRVLLDASVAALNDERAAPAGRYKVA